MEKGDGRKDKGVKTKGKGISAPKREIRVENKDNDEIGGGCKE